MNTLSRRDRVVVAISLATLVALAWTYLWRGAGMGMSALDMTILTVFPHREANPMPGMTPPPFVWAVALAMWWVMMIAMMTPSVAPLVLLYGRVRRHAVTQGGSSATYPSSLSLAAGYLTAWFLMSAAAVAVQYLLQRAGLISAMMLWSQSKLLSAAVLLAAGLYQFSSFKHTCLKHCRGPVEFLTRHWRPGWLGAFRMGVEHGAYCVGCCWVLMALLFVGGVMNLAWIVALTLLVLAEKLAPHGVLIARITGVILIGWGTATLFV